MAKSKLIQIVLSLSFFVIFLVTSFTLIIISSQEKIDLDYRVVSISQEGVDYYVNFEIINNSTNNVTIDGITFYGYDDNGDFVRSYAWDQSFLKGETKNYEINFVHSSNPPLSNFDVDFENVQVKNKLPMLYIGVGFLLPAVISGYFVFVSIYGKIKNKKNSQNH